MLNEPIDRRTKTELPAITVGVIGGIASGKSEVCRYWKSLGGEVISADEIAHQVLARSDVIEALCNALGKSILNSATNSIDRSRVSQLVFGDSEEAQSNRRKLEAVVHPKIHDEIRSRLTEFRTKPARPLMLDIPLLFERGWDRDCDRVLFVDASEAARLSRALLRGWNEKQFRDRESAQLPIEEKKRRATDIVSNDSTLEELHRSLDMLFRRAS